MEQGELANAVNAEFSHERLLALLWHGWVPTWPSPIRVRPRVSDCDSWIIAVCTGRASREEEQRGEEQQEAHRDGIARHGRRRRPGSMDQLGSHQPARSPINVFSWSPVQS